MVDPEDEGVLVQGTASEPVGVAWRGMEHFDPQITDRRNLSGGRGPHRDGPVGRERQQLVRMRQFGGQGRHPQHVDVEGFEDGGHTADMVEVGVAHHREVEVAAAVAPQPAGGGFVLPGIDQDAGTGRFDQERVALPDVDGGHGETRRWNPSDHRGHARRDQRDHDRCRQPPIRRRARPACPRSQQPDARGKERDDGGRPCHLDGAAPSRQPRRGVEYYGSRDTGDCEQPGAHPGMHHRHHRADETDRRGQTRGRNGEEVGGDRHQLDRAEGAQQQWDDGDLRTDGDGSQLGNPPRQTSLQTGTDKGGDHQNACGRGGRQKQSERPRQQRVDQHQHQDRPRQGMACIAYHPTQVGQKEQPGHDSGTQHTRFEPGHEGEPRHHGRQCEAPATCAEPQERRERRHAGDDHGDVHARNGRQVGQAGCQHRVLVGNGEQARVPGHQPCEQTRPTDVEMAGCRVTHTCAHRLGRRRQPSGFAHRCPFAGGEHDGGMLAREPPPVAALG